MINTLKHLHCLFDSKEFQLKGTKFLQESFWLLQKRRLLVQLSLTFTLPKVINSLWGGGVSRFPSSQLPPQRAPSRHASCNGYEPLCISPSTKEHRSLWGSEATGDTCEGVLDLRVWPPLPFIALELGCLASLIGFPLDKLEWRHFLNCGFGHSSWERESKVFLWRWNRYTWGQKHIKSKEECF